MFSLAANTSRLAMKEMVAAALPVCLVLLQTTVRLCKSEGELRLQNKCLSELCESAAVAS